MRCPRFCARLRPSAVRVRIRSRSTSANPPRTAIIERPVLVPVSARGSASDRNCAFASTICLTMAKGAAREAVDARHRHHVAGGEVLEHFEKLSAFVVRARDLLAVNPAAPFDAQLLKLRVERLSVGAHAGIAETPVFGGWFDLGFQFHSGNKLREA
jgi:hypothetical protein